MVVVKIEFLGGLDQSFNGLKETKINLNSTNTKVDSADQPILLSHLISHLCDNYITSTKDMDIFIEEGTIRPRILVLINDTDWELEEKEEYELEDGDVISFTSTLHGG